MTPSPRVPGPVSPLATDQLAVHPLGLSDTALSGGFWARWQQANREVTAPHALRMLERDGSVDNLRRLGSADPGPHQGLWFSDSDVYKVLEAISWEQGRVPSAELAAAVTELAAVLRAAQQPDGYVNSYVQAGYEVRWDNLVTSHELYCIGHMIQAGVAHHRATGGDELFDIVRRAADCVVRDFGEQRRKDTDGHPEVEMALVELYRETGHRPYLDLARQLVDVRGHGVLEPRGGHFDSTYFVDATPVRRETTVVGHAVRALYLLSGVVDVYLETGDPTLLDSAVRQWDSMTATKTYLTGAVGSRFDGESFGEEYELPQDLVYGETCATIAGIQASWRLLLATGESRFADGIERALFNLLAGSTSIERDAFFYNNPAQRRVARPPAPTDSRPQRAEAPGTRPHWFACACCPPNIMRTIASLGAYVATYNDSGIQVQQYIPSTVDTPVGSLSMATGYPLDGAVEVTVTATREDPWTLSLRVPAWCRGASVTVNGQPAPASSSRGYLEITRQWRAGDVVALDLPMPVRLTVAHPVVDAVRGTVAIERGPIVYCFESPDQDPDVDLNRVELLLDEPVREQVREDFLGQRVVVVSAQAIARDDSGWTGPGWATLGEQPEVTGRRVTLTAIPYHLWANRGPSVMRIFTPARAG